MLTWARSRIVGTPLELHARRLQRALGLVRLDQKDRKLMRVLDRILTPTSNSIDVGAHAGKWVHEILRRTPQGTIYAYEPLPYLRDLLEREFKRRTAVVLRSTAVGDRSGEITFHMHRSWPAMSSTRALDRWGGEKEYATITVPIVRLDDDIDPSIGIRSIKLDAEGAEFSAIAGGIMLIRRCQPFIGFMHGRSAAEFGTKSAAMYDLLTDRCGLRISRLDDWLEGRPALDAAAFAQRSEDDSDYFFLAHPN